MTGPSALTRPQNSSSSSSRHSVRSMERASRRHFPWGLYFMGASYLASYGFFLYLFLWGPAELLGFVATFSGEAMEIHSVDSNTVVAQGGLRAGDRVLMVNDRPIG